MPCAIWYCAMMNRAGFKPPSRAAVLRDRRILVVEDSYLVARAIADALENEGAFVIGPVSTVEDAERLAFEAAHLHGAILDVNLRGQMVWPIADRLFRRNVRLVFATGYAAGIVKARYKDVPVIEKPAPGRMIVRHLTTALLTPVR